LSLLIDDIHSSIASFQHSFVALADMSTPEDAYAESLIRRFMHIEDTDCMYKPLDYHRVWVTQDVCLRISEHELGPRQSVLDVIGNTEAFLAGLRVLIEGHDAGRTPAFQLYALKWARGDRALRDKLPMPVLVDVAAQVSLNEYINQAAGARRSNNVVLLLSGLDQLIDAQLRDVLLLDLVRLSKTHRVWIAARTQFPSIIDGMERYVLQLLSPDQISASLNVYYRDTYSSESKDAQTGNACRSRVNAALVSDPAIASMAAHPVLFNYIAQVNRASNCEEDPMLWAASIFKIYLVTLGDKWGKLLSAHISRYDNLDHFLHYLVLDIARSMKAAPLNNFISTSALRALVTKRIGKYMQYECPTAVIDSLMAQLRSMDDLLVWTGLDQQPEEGFAFIHRRLLNYLYALAFYDTWTRRKDGSDDSDLVAMFVARTNGSLPEVDEDVLVFLCSLFPHERLGPSLRQLLRGPSEGGLRCTLLAGRCVEALHQSIGELRETVNVIRTALYALSFTEPSALPVLVRACRNNPAALQTLQATPREVILERYRSCMI
jgi:hypothetical protein